MLGRVGQREENRLLGYADADWANDLDDRKSVSGGALFLGGSLVYWYSRKQNMVSTSTAEAEIHAVLEMVFTIDAAVAVVGEVFWGLLGQDVPIPRILNDNQPGLDAIKARRGRANKALRRQGQVHCCWGH